MGRDRILRTRLGSIPHLRRDDAWPSTSSYSPRTDLAIETQGLVADPPTRGSGIEQQQEQMDGLTVSRVHIRSSQAEKEFGKPRGRYITLEAPGLRHHDPDLEEKVSEQFARELTGLLSEKAHSSVLVVGLGNANVTPDSLGPAVVDRVFVTRHLQAYDPELLDDGYSTVSAVSPGVLGVTGIETTEVVKGIVEKIRPDVVIAVDALAARSLSRVNSTIQITDTGIQPGSGVGNKRRSINEEELGVPVIAVGVPTVLDAATIANDAIDLVLNQLRKAVPQNSANQLFDQFSPQEKWQLIRELLEPMGNNLMVTPKEIDEFVEDIAMVVARGLNVALHPGMSMDDAAQLTR